jgi:ABC-type Mn2+/Zn2+ transport system ATPase subunit
MCRDLWVRYGREHVLRGVSLEIARGSFIPFVGPNGSGKTTLLRAILGLVRPTSGKIVTDFGGTPPGYVPQQGTIDCLFPVSLRQIVYMGLYPKVGPLARHSRKQREEVERVLGWLGLSDHARKTFDELSGGMKQKALIARALIAEAEVLVLDEPTSQLDEESRAEVTGLLLALNREEGKTVLLAHHGLNTVVEMAQTVCLMEGGRATLASTEGMRLPPAPSVHSPATRAPAAR